MGNVVRDSKTVSAGGQASVEEAAGFYRRFLQYAAALEADLTFIEIQLTRV